MTKGTYSHHGKWICNGMILSFVPINISTKCNSLISHYCISALFNPLPDHNFLDWSKLKQTAYDILKCILDEYKVPYRIENIVRKEEIACYKQFLLFSQYFP